MALGHRPGNEWRGLALTLLSMLMMVSIGWGSGAWEWESKRVRSVNGAHPFRVCFGVSPGHPVLQTQAFGMHPLEVPPIGVDSCVIGWRERVTERKGRHELC
jgi:hypothetical protein